MFREEIVKVLLDLGGVRGREEGVVVGVVVPYWNGRMRGRRRGGRLLLFLLLMMPENRFGSSENYRRRIVLSARNEIVV